MKNTFIFFSLLNWIQVQSFSCYECSHSFSEKECLQSLPEVCGIDQEACLTEIRHSPNGRVSYRKSCFQENACINAEKQNVHQCPEVCATCCHGDLCNSGGSDSCHCDVHTHDPPTQSMRKTTPGWPGTKRYEIQLCQKCSCICLRSCFGSDTPSSKGVICSNVGGLVPKCISQRKFPRIMGTAPLLLCEGAANDSLSYCNSSIAYLSFAGNDEYYIIHASGNGEILPCRKIKTEINNETQDFSLYLQCVGKAVGKKKQDIQQRGKQAKRQNGLTVACGFTNDAEEKEKYCGEKNYHCFVMYEARPIKKSPPVAEKVESGFTVTKGILTGFGILAGLFGLALAINFRKKLKSFYQNRVKPVEKQSLADKKVPSSTLSTISS